MDLRKSKTVPYSNPNFVNIYQIDIQKEKISIVFLNIRMNMDMYMDNNSIR